jgi:Outer membrane protein beta-barrel domain
LPPLTGIFVTNHEKIPWKHPFLWRSVAVSFKGNQSTVAMGLSNFRKTAGFLMFWLFFGLRADSQWLAGLEGGLSNNTLLTNIENFPNQRYKSADGLFLTAPVFYRWRSGLTLDGAATFVEKGYRIDTLTTGQTEQARNDYGQLQLGAGYSRSFHKIFLHAAAGLYTGYWLTGHIQGAFNYFFNTERQYQYSQNYVFDSRRDQRWEWGWHAGGELGYTLKGGFIPLVGLQFFQSLQDQQKKYMLDQIPRYNRTWTYSVGVLKQWGRK